jgi:hypothetical protein
MTLRYVNTVALAVVALATAGLGSVRAQGASAAPANTGDPFAYCARIGTIDKP